MLLEDLKLYSLLQHVLVSVSAVSFRYNLGYFQILFYLQVWG